MAADMTHTMGHLIASSHSMGDLYILCVDDTYYVLMTHTMGTRWPIVCATLHSMGDFKFSNNTVPLAATKPTPDHGTMLQASRKLRAHQ